MDGVGNIWSATMEGKAVRKLTNFDSDLIFSYDVSSDNRLVIARDTFAMGMALIKIAK